MMVKRIGILSVMALILLVGGALTQAQTHLLNVTTNDRFGQVLTDGEGNSLYLYTSDSADGDASESACVGACTRNWPPLLVEGESTFGDGIDADLFGTLEREDGTIQVTYNGWPLYRSARDRNPGDIHGHRLGGAFFLVSPVGVAVTEEIVRSVDIDADTMAAFMTRGGQLYGANCAACHGERGQGGVGPGFAGNGALARTEFVAPMILDGFPEHGMPAWKNLMSDEEIAAIATFIRNSWGNEFGAVTPEEVAAKR